MKIRYQKEIDGLRAIAVVSVIFYHLNFRIYDFTLFKGGLLGVDIFFVISGYLITLIILPILSDENYSLYKFFEKRLRRVLPLLIFIILFSLPFAFFLFMPYDLLNFSKSILSSIFFISNLYFYSTWQIYGIEKSNYVPFMHTWSLGVEGQFYIFYPLLLLFIKKFFKKNFLTLVFFFTFFSLILMFLLNISYKSFTFYMPVTRFWELLIGGIIAKLSIKKNNFYLSSTISKTSILIILLSILFFDPKIHNQSIFILATVLSTSLILYSVNKNSYLFNILSNKYLCYIGLISYSLYLWHLPIFTFSKALNFDTFKYSQYYLLCIIFILSIISYHLIEKPFRNQKIISNKNFFLIIFFFILSILFFVYAVISNSGYERRFKDLFLTYGKNKYDNNILIHERKKILEQRASKYSMFYEYFNYSRFEKKINWFEDNNKIKILIIGNSHGIDTFNALYQNRILFKNLDFAYYAIQVSDFKNKKNSEEFINSPNFKNADYILLSTKYRISKIYNDIEDIDIFYNKIKDFKKKIILTSNSPEFNLYHNMLFVDYFIKNTNQFGNDSEQQLKNLNRDFFLQLTSNVSEINIKIKQKAEQLNIKYLDKVNLICDKLLKECEGMTPEGFKIFPDTNHLTIKGAEYLGKKIYRNNWLDLN